MPNHLHGIIVINCRGILPWKDRASTGERFGQPTVGSIPTIVRAFKSACTKRINDMRDARVISPYNTLVDLLSGDITMMRMMKALGKMNIDGSKSKLMTQAGGFIALLESLGAVQVEY